MGLLSKLFDGNKDLEKTAKDLLTGLFNAAEQKASGSGNEAGTTAPGAERAGADPDAPSGFSWGDNMPDEENQYNFNGTFSQYFENIFASDFAEYRFEKQELGSSRRIAYTFYSGASKALVVELMPETCSAYKFRNDCKKEGVPYTRFYIDHDGWWNTRKYVVTRMREAIR
ncbi:MAG: hypothetical protein ILP09_05155 [Oscillospiraceae bacterium]|nr:hypothetical protein [Oscillospiraceae bacterium]